MKLMMVLIRRLEKRVLMFLVFYRCSRGAQDTGDIGNARFVRLGGAAAQFSFDRAKFLGAGPFQFVLLAITKDDSLVLVRVTPPRQNFSAVPPSCLTLYALAAIFPLCPAQGAGARPLVSDIVPRCAGVLQVFWQIDGHRDCC